VIWLLVVMSTASVCECFLRLPFAENIKTLVLYTTKSYRVISSARISDHWKEKVLPLFAAKIFRMSLMLFLFLLISLMPLLIWHYLAVLLGLDLFAFAFEIPGMVAMTAVAVVYFVVRKKLFHG